MSIKLIVVSVLHLTKHIGNSLLASGIASRSQMKANLTYLDRMGKLWFGECRRKSSIQNVVPTVKYAGGNVKCWSCFSTAGVGTLVFIDGNMTGNKYRNILEKNLFKSLKKLNLGNKRMCEHDNDSKHRSYVVAHWLDQNGVERLKWPSFSLDINLIEHMWDELERRMKNEQPKNEKDLKEALLRVWHSVSKDVTKKLVNSIPNRLKEVIHMKGYPTRY